MSEEAGFIAALVAEPSDRTAALAFADWLDERGDPRGPMMRVDEVRAWMAPTYENPLPRLRAAIETGKGVTQASKVLARIGEAAVPELVPLLAHPTPLVRVRAVKALQLMGARAKAAIPALTEMVKGTDRENATARWEAVRLLGVLRAKQDVKAEFAKGLDSPDPAERLAAVESLAKLHTKKTADSLCKALADPSDEVRHAAVMRLFYVVSPATAFAVEPLRKALTDKNVGVRSWAVSTLGQIGPRAAAAVPDLFRLMGKTAGSWRSGCIRALTRIGVGTPEVLEVVLAALRDLDTWHAARDALDTWPTLPASAAPALLDLVRNPNSGNPDVDVPLVECGLRALTRIVPPPPEVLEELRAQLATNRAHVVAEALGKLGPAAAVLLPELTAAFFRYKTGDVYDIARALGKIGGEGITALAQALDREPAKSDPVSVAAAEGLKEAGPAARSALPALLARLRRKNAAAGRSLVVGAIAAIGPEAAVAVPDLVALFLRDNCERYEADSLLAGLRSFGPAVLPFVPQLTGALRQPTHAENHARVVELLTGLIPHGVDALPILRDALRRAGAGDFYPWGGAVRGNYLGREVAAAAVAGLATLGPVAEEAIPDLLLAGQTFDSPELRAQVLAALGAIGGPAIPHIREALADRLGDVRRAAVEALAATGDTSTETREALRTVELDANKKVRHRAAAALQKMDKPKRKRS
jgi:uncharacterized protein (TIGR02996 family)